MRNTNSYAFLLMPHCPVTVVQRYRDGVCSLFFHSFFIICHPYIPLHNDCYTEFWLCQCTIYNIGTKRRFALYLQLSFPSSLFAITVDTSSHTFFVMQHAGIELGPHRYNATLLTSTLCYTRWSLTAHSAHYYHNKYALRNHRRSVWYKN